jgi:hypothetical protein
VGVTRPDVEIEIDALALHGVAPGDAEAVRAALTRELAVLVRERGAPARLAELHEAVRLDAGRLGATSGPDGMGVEIARALYRGLGGGR